MGAICEKIDNALDGMEKDVDALEQYQNDLYSEDRDRISEIIQRLFQLSNFRAMMTK